MAAEDRVHRGHERDIERDQEACGETADAAAHNLVCLSTAGLVFLWRRVWRSAMRAHGCGIVVGLRTVLTKRQRSALRRRRERAPNVRRTHHLDELEREKGKAGDARDLCGIERTRRGRIFPEELDDKT